VAASQKLWHSLLKSDMGMGGNHGYGDSNGGIPAGMGIKATVIGITARMLIKFAIYLQ